MVQQDNFKWSKKINPPIVNNKYKCHTELQKFIHQLHKDFNFNKHTCILHKFAQMFTVAHIDKLIISSISSTDNKNILQNTMIVKSDKNAFRSPFLLKHKMKQTELISNNDKSMNQIGTNSIRIKSPVIGTAILQARVLDSN
jgi:hypothetical protein